jgi:hypothetical protein
MAEPTAVPVCPRCGAPMVVRHRHSDGAPFWGCTRFPECRSILKMAYTASNAPVARPLPSPTGAAYTTPNRPDATPASAPSRTRYRMNPPEPEPYWTSTQSGSGTQLRGFLVLVCCVGSAVCAIAILSSADGRSATVFVGIVVLAFAAIPAVFGLFGRLDISIRLAPRLLGLALLCAFAIVGLVPVSQWLGQIIGNEVVRAIPTLPQHTPSMLP